MRERERAISIATMACYEANPLNIYEGRYQKLMAFKNLFSNSERQSENKSLEGSYKENMQKSKHKRIRHLQKGGPK